MVVKGQYWEGEKQDMIGEREGWRRKTQEMVGQDRRIIGKEKSRTEKDNLRREWDWVQDRYGGSLDWIGLEEGVGIGEKKSRARKWERIGEREDWRRIMQEMVGQDRRIIGKEKTRTEKDNLGTNGIGNRIGMGAQESRVRKIG